MSNPYVPFVVPPAGGNTVAPVPFAPPFAPPGPDPRAMLANQGLFGQIMPASSEFEGLLTNDDVTNARRSHLMNIGLGLLGASGPRVVGTPGSGIGERLAQSLGQAGGWSDRLSAIAERNAALRTRRDEVTRSEQRRAVFAKYPPAPNETPEQAIQRMVRMLPELAEADPDTAGKLVEFLKSQGGDAGAFQLREGVGPSGDPEWYRFSRGGASPTGVPAIDTSADRLAERQTTRDLLQEQRRLQNEDRLASQYLRFVQPWVGPYGSLQRAERHIPAALKNNAAAQSELLFAFIQTLDNTAVRDGERDMYNRALPALAQARAFADRQARGETVLVPEPIVRQMASLLSDVKRLFDARLGGTRRHYQTLARKRKLDPDIFMDITDLTEGLESFDESQPGILDRYQ